MHHVFIDTDEGTGRPVHAFNFSDFQPDTLWIDPPCATGSISPCADLYRPNSMAESNYYGSEMENIPPIDDAPRSLRNAEVLQRRKAMLALSHVAPLTEYAAKLRGAGSVEVPSLIRLTEGRRRKCYSYSKNPARSLQIQGSEKARDS